MPLEYHRQMELSTVRRPYQSLLYVSKQMLPHLLNFYRIAYLFIYNVILASYFNTVCLFWWMDYICLLNTIFPSVRFFSHKTNFTSYNLIAVSYDNIFHLKVD